MLPAGAVEDDAVGGGAGVVVGAVGSDPGGGAIGDEGEGPAAFVDGLVVVFAEWDQVREGRVSGRRRSQVGQRTPVAVVE